MCFPAMQQLMSPRISENAQGELQGAQSSIMAFTLIFSPILMTQTFSAYTAPGAPVHFAGAAFLLAYGLRALWRGARRA